jgi:1-phosphofructokinase family hexose kinase
MIYTLTLNPALDLEYRVDRIQMGAIHRSPPALPDWGGKGFNVSRVLHVLGEESVAVGFAAGYTGKRLDEGLHSCGVRTDLVWVTGETRTNVSIVGPASGDYMKFNEPGPQVDRSDAQRLLAKIREITRPGDFWIMSGSLPPGLASDFYASAISLVKEGAGRVMLDTSGVALLAGCQAGPDLVKPNAEEAAEMTGMSAGSPQEMIAVARRILLLGPRRVVISMGSQGAVAVEGERSWYACPLQVRAMNPVGAGDALVAGLAAGWVRDWHLPEMLRLGMACGASAAAAQGTGIGSREEIETLQLAGVIQTF